ncbi:uncharacterized protein N7503_001773 [Penicillium pulvis]|uniref:uncharacterized protein n=1 Tax=Penicillium pulvis TaxID=1562058 RepID=UPI0025496CC4|nr:uncharacterized protein N7503_001773 [Penicillium pulvis]KAJ5809555.1 hypothetical protein N7503_001773 [Penicillium pulvis]
MANSNRSGTGVPQLNRRWEASAEIGTSETLPPLAHDTVLTPAGPWATVIKRYQFSVAVQGERFKTPLLEQLAQRPSRYEPILRSHYAGNWTPIGFMQEINVSKARVEAVSIQVVGFLQEVPCACCKSNWGVFAHCIRDTTGKCGNCHWRQRACSLDAETQTQTTPKKIKRKTLTQEQLQNAKLEMLTLIDLQGELNERARQLEASMKTITERVISVQDQKLRTNIAIRAQNSDEIAERFVAQDVDLANWEQALRDLMQEHSVESALNSEARERWAALVRNFI